MMNRLMLCSTDRFTLAWLVLAWWAAWPTLGESNAAPPWRKGDLVGEARGVKLVRIVKEDLRIDLRPLERGQPAAIEAVYYLQAEPGAGKVDLVFITGAGSVDGAGVWLNDQSIEWKLQTQGDVPPEWLPPKTTPGFDDAEPLRYNARATVRPNELCQIAFTLNLTPGPHRLKVAYRAEASQVVRREPARFWQLVYILAPAKAWASFAKLEVTVLTPTARRFASSPALAQAGPGVYRGEFDGLPADHLAISTQMPFKQQALFGRWPGLLALVIGGMACGGLALLTGFRAGVRLASTNRFWTALVLRALAAGVLTAIVVGAVLAWFALGNPHGVPAGQDNWNENYGRAMLAFAGVILSVPVTFIGGAVFTVAAFFMGRRMMRHGRLPPPYLSADAPTPAA
jgi:hypothetical protein